VGSKEITARHVTITGGPYKPEAKDEIQKCLRKETAVQEGV